MAIEEQRQKLQTRDGVSSRRRRNITLSELDEEAHQAHPKIILRQTNASPERVLSSGNLTTKNDNTRYQQQPKTARGHSGIPRITNFLPMQSSTTSFGPQA